MSKYQLHCPIHKTKILSCTDSDRIAIEGKDGTIEKRPVFYCDDCKRYYLRVKTQKFDMKENYKWHKGYPLFFTINEYETVDDSQTVSAPPVDNPDNVLLCDDDHHLLVETGEKTAMYKGGQIKFMRYRCPVCYLNYVNLTQFKDQEYVNLGGFVYKNTYARSKDLVMRASSNGASIEVAMLNYIKEPSRRSYKCDVLEQIRLGALQSKNIALPGDKSSPDRFVIYSERERRGVYWLKGSIDYKKRDTTRNNTELIPILGLLKDIDALPKINGIKLSISDGDPFLLRRDEVTRLLLAIDNPFGRVVFYKGDIVPLDLDCIVNSTNSSLNGSNELSQRINREAGPLLHQACTRIGMCMQGEAKITEGYDLNADYVIHTVGPNYRGTAADTELLKACYINALDLAKAHDLHTIAFPAISTGGKCFPSNTAADIALSAVLGWLNTNKLYPMIVFMVSYDSETEKAYQKAEKKWKYRYSSTIHKTNSKRNKISFSGTDTWHPFFIKKDVSTEKKQIKEKQNSLGYVSIEGSAGSTVHVPQTGPYEPYSASKAITAKATTAKATTAKATTVDSKSVEKKEKRVHYIGAKDFMVKGNLFKCMHEKHKIDNITAIVMMITNRGKLVERKISAGYCRDCDVYFILEGTFESLKRQGTICCRITDRKTYEQGKSTNPYGMTLAAESVLKQHGYTVSQTEDLPVARRRQILTLLVDLDILSTSEIISYLDFFINQRKYQDKFEVAVSRWKEDRDFIKHYHIDYNKKQRIKSLFRK